MSHLPFMEKVFSLARQGQGLVSPNPLVGALLVRDGEILGSGFHSGAGKPHAEIMALRDARARGFDLTGATLYSNLEPCCHTNKLTPPCVPEVIKSGVKTVVISNTDPNPEVNGKGVGQLREHGLEVITGIGEFEGAKLNEIFFKYIRTGLPFVHLKMGQTLDGKIATTSGDSKYITGTDSLKRVHETRYVYDAVLIGSNTLTLDNPKLTVRNVEHPVQSQPYRLAFSKLDKLNFNSNLISDDFRSKTIIITTNKDYIKNAKKVKMLTEIGVDVMSQPEDAEGRVGLRDLLSDLAQRKITSLIVEGGTSVYTQFLNEKLYDKISIFIAPLMIGQGRPAIGDLHTETLKEAIRFYHTRFESMGTDMHFSGYREEILCSQV